MVRYPRPIALRLFDRVFLPWMRTRIAVRMAGLPAPLAADRPLILIANHVSWWDGFLLREVHRALRPRAPLHTVMLESELGTHRMLRTLGAVGIDPANAASVAHCIRVLEDRLEHRQDSVVAFFPQGRIWPSHRRPLQFQRGVELFARRLPSADLLPLAIHIEPLNRISPIAFLLAGPIVAGGRAADAVRLEAAVERQLDDILRFLSEHGERAAAEWPGAFELLPAWRAP
ncbi:hypothetical protein BH23GEM6_BH23GEM6_01850 [soil metagenome]